MRKIIAEQRIVARDQNRVFLERASARKLPPADAVEKYGLDPGRGNAYIEFDVESDRLGERYNVLTKVQELYVKGNIELYGREPVAFFNS